MCLQLRNSEKHPPRTREAGNLGRRGVVGVTGIIKNEPHTSPGNCNELPSGGHCGTARPTPAFMALPDCTHPRLLRDFWNLAGFLPGMFMALYIRRSLCISSPAARLLIIAIFPPPIGGVVRSGLMKVKLASDSFDHHLS
jgi:uncharacterized membrane protein YqaE (UPF0057 family)